MRYLAPVLAVTALLFLGAAQTPSNHFRYYVQLIQATDSSQAPQPESRAVGPVLATTLGGALRWRYYWELCRREVDVPLGGKLHVPLANQRAVEIDLARPGKRTILAFQHGELVDRTVVPMGKALSLIGGGREDSTGWFIVVRRDKPGD